MVLLEFLKRFELGREIRWFAEAFHIATQRRPKGAPRRQGPLLSHKFKQLINGPRLCDCDIGKAARAPFMRIS